MYEYLKNSLKTPIRLPYRAHAYTSLHFTSQSRTVISLIYANNERFSVSFHLGRHFSLDTLQISCLGISKKGTPYRRRLRYNGL